jgi:hypothetical protein
VIFDAKSTSPIISHLKNTHRIMDNKLPVLLNLITLCESAKLKNKKPAPRWIGPFRITEVIGNQAYRLALPAQYSRLHDVFPIQLLEKYHARDDTLMPMPELEDDSRLVNFSPASTPSSMFLKFRQ